MLSKLQETIEIYGFNPNQGIQQQSQRFHELASANQISLEKMKEWRLEVIFPFDQNDHVYL